jgi:lipooligosaccharide transport system permease protein
VRPLHLVERAARVYRRGWTRSVGLTFLQPLLMLSAMGLGVGALVDRSQAGLPGGASYIAFLAPGLMAATCMQSASFESAFPVHGRLVWQGSYLAIANTPMRIVDIVLGELSWVALRLTVLASAFLLVSMTFGAARGWTVLAAIPAAVLTGVAFASCVLAYSGTLGRSGNYNAMFRFIITPLALFSGVYFPIERMPAALQHLAVVTPLYHGVALTRGVSLHTLDVVQASTHVAYLLLMTAVGVRLATASFTRKLLP